MMLSSASGGIRWRISSAVSANRPLLAAGLLFVASAVTLTAFASEGVVPYDRIEEDWEVVIGEPDPDTHAPQLINVISPTLTLSQDYAVMELNHGTQPEYFEGGLQLQMWCDDEYHSNYTPRPSLLLSIPGETIRYTMAMSIEQGQLKVRVRNGTSTSWGSFGGDSLVVSCPARQPHLKNYSTSLSVAKSRVAFAKHRVEKFALKRVRYYHNDNLVKTDETVRQVYPPTE